MGWGCGGKTSKGCRGETHSHDPLDCTPDQHFRHPSPSIQPFVEYNAVLLCPCSVHGVFATQVHDTEVVFCTKYII